jgi:phage terminase Nu1 subunit (DNA packaging protein)
MAKTPSESNSTLNSWKEIATFLGRGVRTVQRWERELGLPVHRVRRTEHSPVFAYRKEVQAWINAKSQLLSPTPATQGGGVRLRRSEIHDFHEQTMRRSQDLVRKLGSLVAEQRNRAETLAQVLRTTETGIRKRRRASDKSGAEHTRGNRV